MKIDDFSSKLVQKLNHEKINTPQVIASKTTQKLMIFHRNSNRNTSTKNQHAEGNCIKKRAKINDFSCEFKQNRTLMNFRRNSSRNWTTKNRHAEGNCIKKHAKIDVFFVEIRSEMEPRKNRHAEENCIKKHAEIDDFSLKFEQKLKHEKSSRRR